MKPFSTTKSNPFRPGWFIYPHAGIAIIVLSESELAEQEAVMGNGEYIREATEGELAYQTSGIPGMVAEYHSIISGASIESITLILKQAQADTNIKNRGLAS